MFMMLKVLLMLSMFMPLISGSVLTQKEALAQIKLDNYHSHSVDNYQLLVSLTDDVLKQFPFCDDISSFEASIPCTKSHRVMYAISKKIKDSDGSSCLILISTKNNNSSLSPSCLEEVSESWNTDSVVNFQDRVWCQANPKEEDIFDKNEDLIPEICSIQGKKIRDDPSCTPVSAHKSWMWKKDNFYFVNDVFVHVRDDLDSRSNFDCGSSECDEKCLSMPCRGEKSFCERFGSCDLAKSQCYCKFDPKPEGSLHTLTIGGKKYNPSCWGSSNLKMEVMSSAKISKNEFEDSTIVCTKEGLVFTKGTKDIRVLFIRKGNHEEFIPVIQSPLFLPSYFRGEVEITLYFKNRVDSLVKSLVCPKIENCDNVRSSQVAVFDLKCRQVKVANVLPSMLALDLSLGFGIAFCVITLLILFFGSPLGKELLFKLSRFFRSNHLNLSLTRKFKKQSGTLLPLHSNSASSPKRLVSSTGSSFFSKSSLALASASYLKQADAVNFLEPINQTVRSFETFSVVLLALIVVALILTIISKLFDVLDKIKRNKIISSVLAICFLMSLIPFAVANEGCQFSSTFQTQSEECVRSGSSVSCSYGMRTVISANSASGVTCLQVKNQEDTLEFLKVRILKVSWICSQEDLYYTYNPTIECKAVKECSNHGYCKDDNCVKFSETTSTVTFPEHLKDLGLKRCSVSAGGWFNGCMSFYDACLFKFAILRNPTSDHLKVVKCSAWKSVVDLEIVDNGKTSPLSLTVGQRGKVGDLNFEISAMSFTPSRDDSCYGIDSTGISKFNCNKKDQLMAGQVGEIQCVNSNSALLASASGCKFSESIVEFSDLSDSTTCSGDFVDPFKVAKENYLPARDGDFLITSENGIIRANLLENFNMLLTVSSKGRKVSMVSDKADCAVLFESISGCYSCREGAILHLRGHCKKTKMTCIVSCPSIQVTSTILLDEDFKTRDVPFFTDKPKINSNCFVSCNSQTLRFGMSGELDYVPSFNDWRQKNLKTAESNFEKEGLQDFFNMIGDKIRSFSIKAKVVLGLILSFLILSIIIYLKSLICSILPKGKKD